MKGKPGLAHPGRMHTPPRGSVSIFNMTIQELLDGTTTIVDAYLAGPDELRLAVADMSRDQLLARLISGKWSVLEVVCHLADTESNIAHRLKRVLSENRPEFERVQPDRLLAALLYHSRDPGEEISLINLRPVGRSPGSCETRRPRSGKGRGSRQRTRAEDRRTDAQRCSRASEASPRVHHREAPCAWSQCLGTGEVEFHHLRTRVFA